MLTVKRSVNGEILIVSPTFLTCPPGRLVYTGGGSIFQPTSAAEVDLLSLCYHHTHSRCGYGGYKLHPASTSKAALRWPQGDPHLENRGFRELTPPTFLMCQIHNFIATWAQYLTVLSYASCFCGRILPWPHSEIFNATAKMVNGTFCSFDSGTCSAISGGRQCPVKR